MGLMEQDVDGPLLSPLGEQWIADARMDADSRFGAGVAYSNVR